MSFCVQEGDRRSLPIFTSLLVSGIILAAVLVGVYIWKNHCRTNANSMKLVSTNHTQTQNLLLTPINQILYSP